MVQGMPNSVVLNTFGCPATRLHPTTQNIPPSSPVATALRPRPAPWSEALLAARPQEIVGADAVHGPDWRINAVVKGRPPEGRKSRIGRRQLSPAGSIGSNISDEVDMPLPHGAA